MRIIITGATGLIGRHVTYALLRAGHDVTALTRSAEKLPELPSKNIFHWTDQDVPSSEIFKNSDIVLHLAGEGIVDQFWTEARKRRLRDSRIAGTKNIIESISKLPQEQRPKTLISGSAIGFYAESSAVQNEKAGSGKGFLADLCVEWESAALEAEKLGLRTVILRTGLVLAREGGLLKKAAPVILGDGQQWMSWVHIIDVVRFIEFAMNTASVKGAFNLTAPNPVTNAEFTKTFAAAKSIPMTLSAPAFVLKLVAGELSSALLANQNIYPQNAFAAGFEFNYVQLKDALNDLVANDRFVENHFSVRQFVPIRRQEVFAFFSKAENLEFLTPPWLNFKIVKQSTPQVQKATLIDYKLKIHGMPVSWRTLIQEWNPDHSFVDFQLKGPYRKWHHLHTFEDVAGGTLISDIVTFEIPGWIFGKALLPIIKKDVQDIFNYRQKKIKELYSSGGFN